MTATAQLAYCSAPDVQAILFGGVSSTPVQPDTANRDSRISDLCYQLSRRFDDETGRPVNGFGINYESRLYSGRGAQLLEIDEFAAISVVEWNSTPTGAASWNDISTEITTSRIVMRPIRFWPKNMIFRQQTWIVDPWGAGNYRLTGIWGAVQPDMGVQPPLGQSPSWNGLSDAAIKALAPNPAGPTYGWWIVPLQVRMAIAEWAVYKYKGGQSGNAQTPGRPGTTAPGGYVADAPPDVNRTIQMFRGSKMKLALIGIDGSDPTQSDWAYDPAKRWSGWHSFDPTGNHPENVW